MRLGNNIVSLSFEEKLFKDGKIKVLVKEGVIDILRAVEKEVGPMYEFSVLFKAHWDDEKGAYVVEPEYHIPKQKVRSSFVEITEDVAGKILSGFTVAFHKHPRGLRSFSGHDYENICAVFPISLLYVDGEVPIGTVKVPLPDANATVLVPADIEVIEDLPEVEGVGKIEKDIDEIYEGVIQALNSATFIEEIKDILDEWSVSSLEEFLHIYGDESERLSKAIKKAIVRFGNVKIDD